MRIILNINHNSEGLFKILLVCLNRYRAIICVWKRGAGQRAFFDLYGPQDRRNCGPKGSLRVVWPAKAAAEGRDLTDAGTTATTTSTAANSAATEDAAG